MGNDERVSARYAHWAVVSVLASAVILWMAAMSGTVPDATSVQEQRIEIAIRSMCMPKPCLFLREYRLHWSSATRPVQRGFVSPMFAALYIPVDWEGIEAFGKSIEGVHLDSDQSQRIPDLVS